MMKTVVINGAGPPEVLQLVEKPVPAPGQGQVLIRVKAAGVNRPDISQRKGHYPPPPGAPQDVPGLEVAGIIESCGKNAGKWKTGDAVCALINGGGYAEFAIAYEGHCLPLPGKWDFIESASLPETVFTVWHNVFQRGKLKPGEHLLVHGGSSGIGITAIQLARAIDAFVSVTAGNKEKCKACIELGANYCINYNAIDFEVLLREKGVDVILDMVGGDYIPKNISLLKEDGRLVFINAMKGNSSSFLVFDIMKKRLTITGSTLRNRDVDFKTELAKEVLNNVWPMISAGKFRPVIHSVFPLSEAAKAHALMETSQHIGKIILVNE